MGVISPDGWRVSSRGDGVHHEQEFERWAARDHLGGGVHRYLVDEFWHVPHFEKMLYDQAQLTVSFTEAWQLTHDEFFADIARATLDYILRDMTHPEGDFFSAEEDLRFVELFPNVETMDFHPRRFARLKTWTALWRRWRRG